MKPVYIVAAVLFGLSLFEITNGQSIHDLGASMDEVATLLRSQKQEEAVRLAQKMLNASTRFENNEDMSFILFQTASMLSASGINDEAEPLFKKSLAMGEKLFGKDSGQVCMMMFGLGRSYKTQGRYMEALPLLEKAAVVCEANNGKIDPETANAWNSVGHTYLLLGLYDKAKPIYEKVLDICEKVHGKEHPHTAIALSGLGSLLLEERRYADAEDIFKRAVEIAERAKEGGEAAVSCLNLLANLYRRQGHYWKAKPIYEKALANSEKVYGTEHPMTAVVLDNLATLYFDEKNFVEAADYCSRALQIFNATLGPIHPDTLLAFNKVGLCLAKQNRYEDALPFLTESANAMEQMVGKEHPWTLVFNDNLADLYKSSGRNDKAIEIYKKTLAIWKSQFGAEHTGTMTVANNLAYLYAEQKRYDLAEPLFDGVVANMVSRGVNHNAEIGTVQGLAQVYYHTNRQNKAVSQLKKAMDLSLEVRKQASGSDEQRAQTFAAYYDLFETMVDWQYELGDMNEAYEAMERSRAQGLQDLINSNNIDLLEGVPPATAKKLRDIENAALTDVASYEKQLELQPKNEKLKNALKSAQKRLVDAMAAIRSASPAYRLMLSEDRKPVALETVRKEFGVTKIIALEYLVGGENSYVLVYGPNVEPTLLPLVLNEAQAQLFDVDVGPLTSKKLEAILQNEKNDGVLQLVGDSENVTDTLPTKETLDKLAVLWHLLVPDESIRSKLLDGKSFARLLVLPDGALARLPFEMLVVEPDVVNPRYLLDNGPAVIYAPSASMYYNLNRRNIETKTAKTLTVGNPDYTRTATPSDTVTKIHNSRRAARMGPLDPLTWTEHETAWIEESSRKNNISVTRLNLLQSTEENIRKNTSGRRIVHLACHGLAEGDFGNAIFSALAVTVGNPNDPKNDGFLDLAEMFGLDLKSCELAVLSACDTNLGPNQHGEGTWSMGRGMLASGARRVVTTDWQVADDASAHLIFRFIDTVNQAKAPDYALALRDAKRSIRSNENAAWRHPYYWAPFVLIGPN